MRFTKLFAAGATILASAAALAACGNNNSGSSKQTLSWMDNAEIPTMDISKATDATSFNQLNNVEEGLYRLGKDSKAEPALAKTTKITNGGKTWTFTLRSNKWNDGTPVTAKDFVYSWRRTVNPKTASQYAYLFEGIHNADAIQNKKASVNSLGIKAEGNNKLVVTLDKRIPYFKLLMGFPLFFPQEQKVVQKDGSKYGTTSSNVAYDGPFIQKGWTGSDNSWKLVKNNNYWDKKHVKLQTINYSVQKTPSTAYNLYQSGKLDATALDSNQTKQLKGHQGYTLRPQASTAYVEFNQRSNKVLKNANIRRAISLAINRKTLCNALGGSNIPATSVTARHLTKVNGQDFVDKVNDKDYVTYNPKRAEQLFKKGMKQVGVKKVNLSILSDDTDAGQKTTESLQSNLEQNLKGIKVSVQNVPFKTRLSRSQSGNFDMVVSIWAADFSDPISFDDLFTSNNPQNDGRWKNSHYDSLIAASKSTASSSQRFNDLAQAEKTIMNDSGIAPLYWGTQAWMVKPSVKNVIYNAAGVNYNFKEAYIK